MSFAHSGLAILAALAFPAAFVAQRTGSLLERRAAYAYSNLAFLTEALRAPVWPGVVLDAAGAFALCALLLAAAQPRYYVTVPAGATLAICIDTSGSMRSRDVAPSRARAALRALRAFVTEVPPGTRIGITSFAGTAQIVAFPSVDRRAVLAGLASVPLPNGQTAIGDGLRVALAILPASGTRAIVLVTDGTNNRGEDPGGVAMRLRSWHIRLDVIGVGSGPLSEPELRRYAAETGGSYIRIRSATELPREVLRAAREDATIRKPRECSEAFVFSGLFLLTAAWFAAKRGAFLL